MIKVNLFVTHLIALILSVKSLLKYKKVFNKWISAGGQAWQLIEPIDGFHINQIAHTLASDIYWDILMTLRPEWLGPLNPHNDEIGKIFGDQGGY